MRSALLEIEGVTRVQVLLASGDVIVTYDATMTTVEALIDALEAATGPLMPRQYDASIKEAPQPVPSAP